MTEMNRLRGIFTAGLMAVLGMSSFAMAETPSTQPAVKPYPLDTCVVSGQKLGTMGDPVVINYEGQEIKFCCEGCDEPFRKDPEKYLKKLKSAPTTKPAADQHHDHSAH